MFFLSVNTYYNLFHYKLETFINKYLGGEPKGSEFHFLNTGEYD